MRTEKEIRAKIENEEKFKETMKNSAIKAMKRKVKKGSILADDFYIEAIHSARAEAIIDALNWVLGDKK